jgi:hypothetical protein
MTTTSELPESFEYREDRYLLSGIEFLDQDERIKGVKASTVERQAMLSGNEVDAVVIQALDLGAKVTSHLRSALGPLFLDASVELRFYPFEILEQRTIVRARWQALGTIEAAVMEAVDFANDRNGLEPHTKELAQLVGTDREASLSFLGNLGRKLSDIKVPPEETALYWAHYSFLSPADRVAALAAFPEDAKNVVPLADDGAVSLHGAWALLFWVAPNDSTSAESRRRIQFAQTLSSTEEILLHTSGLQYAALLKEATYERLPTKANHDVRRLFSANALTLARVLALRTCITGAQRGLLERLRETTGRIEEKRARYDVLRAELDAALATTQVREARRASLFVTVILGLISIFGLSSLVFDGADFVAGGPFFLTTCSTRQTIAALVGVTCGAIVLPFLWAVRRL